jgi:hypothetical protein
VRGGRGSRCLSRVSPPLPRVSFFGPFLLPQTARGHTPVFHACKDVEATDCDGEALADEGGTGFADCQGKRRQGAQPIATVICLRGRVTKWT